MRIGLTNYNKDAGMFVCPAGHLAIKKARGGKKNVGGNQVDSYGRANSYGIQNMEMRDARAIFTVKLEKNPQIDLKRKAMPQKQTHLVS